jgi:hypothetical protein
VGQVRSSDEVNPVLSHVRLISLALCHFNLHYRCLMCFLCTWNKQASTGPSVFILTQLNTVLDPLLSSNFHLLSEMWPRSLFSARQLPVGQGLLIHEVSRSHTTMHHSR